VRGHSSSIITVAESPNPFVFVQAMIRILFPTLNDGYTTHLTSAV